MSSKPTTFRRHDRLMRVAVAATLIALLGIGAAALHAARSAIPMTEVTFQRSGGTTYRAVETANPSNVLKPVIDYGTVTRADAAQPLFDEAHRREVATPSAQRTDVFLDYSIRDDQLRSLYGLVAGSSAIEPSFEYAECALPSIPSPARGANQVVVGCAGSTQQFTLTFANSTEAGDFVTMLNLGRTIADLNGIRRAKLIRNADDLVYIHYLP